MRYYLPLLALLVLLAGCDSSDPDYGPSITGLYSGQESGTEVDDETGEEFTYVLRMDLDLQQNAGNVSGTFSFTFTVDDEELDGFQVPVTGTYDFPDLTIWNPAQPANALRGTVSTNGRVITFPDPQGDLVLTRVG
jgi:hypothetical protein